MNQRSKLVSMHIKNIGCIGNEGVSINLDNIVCLVGENNAGKSTILRCYELAVGSESFQKEADRCIWSDDSAASEIILDVHIPDGIGNVDKKWKIIKNNLLIVRSRWQWIGPDFQRVRTTWDPEKNEWAVDGKAGGADPVFNSRLPRPLRISSLDDAKDSEEALLMLALTPFSKELKGLESDNKSPLKIKINELVGLVNSLTINHKNRFDDIADNVGKGFNKIFPGLGVTIDIKMAPPPLKLDDLLKKGSSIKISDGDLHTTLSQQGTGARRALFWAMLQVHNEITRDIKLRDERKKFIESEIKAAKKAGKDISNLEENLKDIESGNQKISSDNDLAFPGYLLLIDEPENALHPMAARAAQRHLYQLAEDPDWQVMLTTHSPYFINPLADHTTIVRLERKIDNKIKLITPRTYRTSSVKFDDDTRKQLHSIQQMDVGLSEIFFGSYPIIVEGDTEHAAFIAAVLQDNHDLADRVSIVRSRGKAIIGAIIKIMHHFNVNFGIVHDSDPPFRNDGGNNGMWTENKKIFEGIEECRKSGIEVRHRISIPDFERFLGNIELGKDKPISAYMMISSHDDLKQKIIKLLNGLIEGNEPCQLNCNGKDGSDFMTHLKSEVDGWAAKEGVASEIRFSGKKAPTV